MKVIKFATGLAIGYVLGSRAGRDKYQQIVAAARKAGSHPAVVEAQQKVKTLLGPGADTSANSDLAASPTLPDVTAAEAAPGPARRPSTPTVTADPLA